LNLPINSKQKKLSKIRKKMMTKEGFEVWANNLKEKLQKTLIGLIDLKQRTKALNKRANRFVEKVKNNKSKFNKN
jgi:hypothetical protein